MKTDGADRPIFLPGKRNSTCKAKWWERTVFQKGLRMQVSEGAGSSTEQVVRGLFYYTRVWNKEHPRVRLYIILFAF